MHCMKSDASLGLKFYAFFDLFCYENSDQTFEGIFKHCASFLFVFLAFRCAPLSLLSLHKSPRTWPQYHQLLFPLKSDQNGENGCYQLFSIFVFSFDNWHYKCDNLSLRVLFQRWNGTCSSGTFQMYFQNPTCVSTDCNFSATKLEKCGGCLQNRQRYGFWLWKSLWKMLRWRRSKVSFNFFFEWNRRGSSEARIRVCVTSL